MTHVTAPIELSDEQLDGLVSVLSLIRSGQASTRPELARLSGLGRGAVAQRVATLLSHGLLEESGLAVSTGGRAPRELHVRAAAGLVLVAPLGATRNVAGIADLSGALLVSDSETSDIAAGPETVLARVEQLLDRLLADPSVPTNIPIVGIGVGLPGPVEFASGRPSSPPIMPGWDGYDVRTRLQERYGAPVWVDNDVNLMALGEIRSGLGKETPDVIYIKIGTGIGAGLVSGGRLHRGAQGCSGDIGHVAVPEGQGIVCRCGNVGCLEAVAGGGALSRAGEAAAREGRSPVLEQLLRHKGFLLPSDITRSAAGGDPTAVELIETAGRLVGETLATLVNFFNPSLVLLGGEVAQDGDLLLANVRETVYRRSLPLATRNLRILRSPVSPDRGLLGTIAMVTDELFGREHLARWPAYGAVVPTARQAGSRHPSLTVAAGAPDA